MTAPHARLIGLSTALLATVVASATAQDPAAPPAPQDPPWFVDVATEVGLTDDRAKDCVFTDLDGDGWLDLVLSRRTFLVSRKRGTRFKEVEGVGIPFPVVKQVPLGRDGKPDQAKASTKELVPHYLYFADIDNDGDQDALAGIKATWVRFGAAGFESVAASDHGARSTVWLNDGRGRFARGPASDYTLPANVGPVMALAVCDVDQDGLLDVFEGREYQVYGQLEDCGIDRLFRGDGRGGFADITTASRLTTLPVAAGHRSSRPTYGVTHGDMDGDGDQDLLALSYGRQWNRQWRNEGDGTFVDVGRETMFAGDAIQHGKYPEWAQEFFKRRGAERSDEAPFRANGNTFDCAVADYDNDGDLDCFIGEITHAWAGESSDLSALLVNQGNGFKRITVADLLPPRKRREERSWNNGDLHVALADIQNDGLQDLLIASGDYADGQFLRVYFQNKDHTFKDVTERLGMTWEGCGSLSLGDYDRDGDVDILIGRSFMRLNKAHREKFMPGLEINRVGLLRNDVANRSGNHFLTVKLVGKGAGGANRSGIGARVEVVTGKIRQLREIRAGSGLANHQDPPEAYFGLGRSERIDRLVVRWNDAAGTVQRFTDVPANRFVTVVQGKDELQKQKVFER